MILRQAVIRGVAGRHGQRFRVYAWGVSDGSTTSIRKGRACSLTLPGQPANGFETAADAQAWTVYNWPRDMLAAWCATAGNGTSVRAHEKFVAEVAYPSV